MSEETKNAAELTDKQLEKVAGGKGGEPCSFKVINHDGAIIYLIKTPIAGIGYNPLGKYRYGEFLTRCTPMGDWVFVPSQLRNPSGYVKISDLGFRQ